ncbi:MAG: cytosine permease [Tenacibaculum sp.]
MIKKQEKTKWFSLASIWFGGIVSVPALLIGSMLISSLQFSSSVIAGFLGFTVVVVLMSIISISAVEKQQNAVSLAASSFGNKGAAIIVGLVLGLSTLGWFAIQSNIAGASFSKILSNTFQLNIPAWLSSAFWGLVMIFTAVFGFKILKLLNYIAVPAIVLLIAYALYTVFQTHNFEEILNYRPKTEMPLLQAVGLAIGFISVGVVISPDYNRFAATKKDAILGSFFGILPASLFLLITGALLAITQGTYDIVEIFAKLGFAFFAMTILILATWTSNVMNIYSSGLAFNTMFNFSENFRPKITLIVGLAGIALACMGLINYFTNFIKLLTLTVSPIAGILVADYFCKKQNFTETAIHYNWKGITAWCIGVITMLLIKSSIKYILGILIALLAHYLLSKAKAPITKSTKG